jgi:hypothetical protein
MKLHSKLSVAENQWILVDHRVKLQRQGMCIELDRETGRRS